MRRFSTRIVAWQRRHGRRGLPWQDCRDPYRVWLSEIMLQQTQVATVLPYYARFLAAFPDVRALAAAPRERVLELWAGLGYYTRARNLHDCAQQVLALHGGAFPRTAAELAQLPGIGRSTAAAIAAFCFDERVPILDGNVKRVLARHFAVPGDPATAPVERRLWALAAAQLPPADAMPAYTQGVMDLGATVCVRTAPRCTDCPVQSTCGAHATGRVAEFPGRRAARAVPLRAAHWLLPVEADGVLLERRGPEGLWGGLLAPLQFDSADALQQTAAHLGVGELSTLAPRRHGFTHFTLEYTVHCGRPAPARQRVAEATLVRVRWDDVDAAAVPAPVRKLLRELCAV